MDKKHVCFVALVLAVSATQFAISISTVDEKPEVVNRDEERGDEAFKLMEQAVAKSITLLGKKIVVPDEPTGQILSETEQEAFPQMIYPEGNPSQKTIKLLGTTIPVPTPAVADQLASQGNVRNRLAVDNEKMKQLVTKLGADPGQTSSPQGKTMMEAGPSDPNSVEEVGHGLRGAKRKVSSRDEPPIQDAQREVGTDLTNQGQAGQVFPLSELIRKWDIDATQLEQRRDEISKQLEQRREVFSKTGLPDKLQLSKLEMECMAVGSIYFERKLKRRSRSARPHRDRLEEKLVKVDSARLQQLGVDREKMNERAHDVFRNELYQARVHDIVYMAIGMEFYRPPHPSGFSS